MTDTQWAAAAYKELGHFLDRFEHAKSVTVKPGHDVVAAIIGVLEALPVIVAALQRAENARLELAEGLRISVLLESPPPSPTPAEDEETPPPAQ